MLLLLYASFCNILKSHSTLSDAVQPSRLDASKCTCSGEGLAHAIAGQPASFKLHALDVYGNTRTQGGDVFAVSAVLQNTNGTDSSAAVQGKVDEVGEGMYRATYTVTTAGSHEVSVTSLEGKPNCKYIKWHYRIVHDWYTSMHAA